MTSTNDEIEKIFKSIDHETYVNNLLKLYKLDSEVCKSRANRNCTNNARCLKGLGLSDWLDNENDEKKDDPNSLDNEQQYNFRGLKNLGATCYINTFLQLWFHNVNLRKAIYRWRPNYPSESAQTNPISCLQTVLALMQFSARASVDPSPFIKCLQLDASQEQDTHEFSSLFNSYIQNKLNNENDKSIQNAINQQYCMKIAYIIRCSNCNVISERESDFYELLLRVKGFKDIDECISDYLKEECLEDNNKYACQICNGLQDAKRFIELRKLPPVLNLQLLRFESSNGRNRKISSFLKFPTTLDMKKWIKTSNNDPNTIYNLFAVLIHEGQTAYSGHYITFIRKGDNWFKFNDENVEQLKDFNLKIDTDDEFKNNEKKSAEKGYHKSKNAYMLVYRLASEPEFEFFDSLETSQLPEHLIDRIKQENEATLHQKSLERMDQSLHQTQIKGICSQMEVDSSVPEYDAIDKSWLMKLFKTKISSEVTPVTNETLLCAHKKLNLDSPFKCISKESADLIYALYNGDVRIRLPDYFCRHCVTYRIYMDQLKHDISDDSREISSLLKYKNADGERMFWVGKESFKKWKNIKMNAVKRQFNEETDDDLNFNEDLLCQHGNLCSDPSKKRLVREVVWRRLQKHFPGASEFEENASLCTDCLEMDKTKQIIRDKNQKIALIQRSSLEKLFEGETCRSWSDLLPGQVYHIIPTKFYLTWKKFLLHPNTFVCPESLTQYQTNIQCRHSLFLFPLFDDQYVGYEKNYLILDQNEWDSLTNFYPCSFDITAVKQDNDFRLSLEHCQTCFTNYVREEKQKRFIYDKVPIYVKKVIPNEVSDVEESGDELSNNENAIKKAKKNGEENENGPYPHAFPPRRSLRKRRQKNELEINVSSSDKLKDIKFKIMQHFNVATYDQVLIYNNVTLSSVQNNCTLSQLEIEPYSSLILKVDDKLDENTPNGECLFDANLGSEAGFKGTQLQLF